MKTLLLSVCSACALSFASLTGLDPVVWAHEGDHEIVEDTIQLEDFLDFESVSNPQVSPDGSQILYTRTRIDKLNDKRISTLWLMKSDGSRNRQLMEGGGGLWSPDGSRIAFVKTDKNGKRQIFTRYMDAEGLVTQVTSFEHGPRSMSWSPNGESLAFVARVPMKSDWTVKLPGRPEGAKWQKDPVVIDSFHYRQDRVGYTNSGFDHLFVVPAIGGTPKQLTKGEFNVGQRALGVIAGAPSLSWSPDSQKILIDGPGKMIDAGNWFESHIHVVDVETAELTTLTSGSPTFGSPVFSPQGDYIAFSGYPKHDTSYPVPKLYVMDADGSGQKILAEDLLDGPQSLTWHSNNREILFTMNAEGDRNIHSVSLTGVHREVTQGDQVLGLSSLSDSGKAAITVSKADMPGTIALTSLKPGSTIKPLVDVNADVFEGKTLGRVEEIWYDAEAETGESAKVQGWIVYPPDYNPDKTYPLLLSIHGGPHAMSTSGFNFTFQEFAARGYVVLYTNPRGSTGYGDEFANAIRHRYPGPIDYADLMAGVDLVVERGIADPERMFVTGCSGGGVLTTWVISKTDRFKAAAALCPV